jgi:hypothetical protein
MRPADANQPKHVIAHRYLQGLGILTLCLMCASGSTLFAQSGRSQTPTETSSPKSETTSPQSPEPDKYEKKAPLPSPAFIVVTNTPDRSQENQYQSGYPQPNFEYLARSGCLLELRSIPGAKVAEDEDVPRWEARETALGEDKAWVIWMELRWDKASSTYDPTPFRLRYLLFEPRTGRIAASGVGNGVRQTWGRNQSRSTSLEEQLREAGRHIADQVLSELKILR